jgi:hypothetical protein
MTLGLILAGALILFCLLMAVLTSVDWGGGGTYGSASRDINRISSSAHSHIDSASEEYLKRVRDNARR